MLPYRHRREKDLSTLSHTVSFELERPVEVVFPLFTPAGERDWVPGWDFTSPMPGTELCEDYIFQTAGHAHAATPAIWLVKRYEPAAFTVQYYKVEPGDKVGVVTVRCRAAGPGRTVVEVTYRYTALSDSGREFIEAFTRPAFEAFIGEWRVLLSRYFEQAD